MRRQLKFIAVLVVAWWGAPAIALAQQRDSPLPILRASVDPPRVVVGQKMVLRIDVLAPNYMTAPPVIPEFQIRNAVTRRLGTVNMSEPHDSMTFAGVRYEFAIYPLEPGSYEIANQSVMLTYAADPPRTREATLPLPRIGFGAIIPDGAASLEPFVGANSLAIEQNVRQSSAALKVGDTVTRTVTVTAAGTPAMLLPPIAFAAIDGMALYSGQPSLQDQSDPRTDVMSAVRVDTATYILEKAGDRRLPAIAVEWWNLATGRVETARLDAIALHVVDDPNAVRAPGNETQKIGGIEKLIGRVRDHWVVALIVLAGLGVLGWLTARLARAGIAWRRGNRGLHETEPAAFLRLLATARHRDPRQFYAWLRRWVAFLGPIVPDGTLGSLKAAARSNMLDAQIAALEQTLFAPIPPRRGWSRPKMVFALIVVRQRLRRRTSRTKVAQPLPRHLNPVTADDRNGRPMRPIAR